jgi:hypothetical protein
MSQPASAFADFRNARQELFQHREVSFGRHCRAVLASVLAQGAVQASVAMFLVVAVMGTNAGRPIAEQMVSGFLAWTVVALGTALVIAVPTGIVMTLARAVLGRFGRSTGAAYMLVAFALGVAQGVITGSMSAKPFASELICGAAFGAISGIVYWQVARRGGEEQASMAAVFS